jgi:hypothetical protein
MDFQLGGGREWAFAFLCLHGLRSWDSWELKPKILLQARRYCNQRLAKALMPTAPVGLLEIAPHEKKAA